MSERKATISRNTLETQITVTVNLDGSVTRRDEFVRIDAGIGWQATPQWQLRFHGENLTDERDFGTTISGVSADDGGKLGRVFWLGANITF